MLKNWNVISEMENLNQLSLMESVLRHKGVAKHVFSFPFPKLRFLMVHRDFGYEDSCLAGFSEMLQSIGPRIQGLKISQTFVCTKDKVRHSKTCAERFWLRTSFLRHFCHLQRSLDKRPFGFY